MNLIEQIGHEAILRALFTGQTSLESESVSTPDASGNLVQHQTWRTVPSDSIVAKLINDTIGWDDKGGVRRTLLDLAVNYLKEHPELLAKALIEHVTKEVFRRENERYGSGTKAVYADQINAVIKLISERVLSEDSEFRARVLDMAHMSDADHINVTIMLAPKGQ